MKIKKFNLFHYSFLKNPIINPYTTENLLFQTNPTLK